MLRLAPFLSTYLLCTLLCTLLCAYHAQVLRLAPFLSTYVDYCTSFAHAVATLNDGQRDPRLRSAVRDVEQVLADLEFDDGAEDLDAPGAALLSYP